MEIKEQRHKAESEYWLIKNLKVINHIHFSYREIDVITCVLGGRTYKRIAFFLSISPKTVENHISSILKKINGNSRESIIKFIEKSDKFSLIKKYYVYLLIKELFKLELKKISSLTKDTINCFILYRKEPKIKNWLTNELNLYLTSVGINAVNKVWKKGKPELLLNNNEKTGEKNYIVYIVSNTFIEELQADKYNIKEEAVNLINKYNNLNKILFVLLNTNSFSDFCEESNNVTCLSLVDQKNHYFLFFEILETLMPNHNIEESSNYLKQQYELLFNDYTDQQSLVKNELPVQTPMHIEQRKYSKLQAVVGSIVIFLGLMCFGFLFNVNRNIGFMKSKFQNTPLKQQQITTMLNLPPRNSKFTGRQKLLIQIGKQLGKQKLGVITQTISGLGGVGKTQLATEFAYCAAEKNSYGIILWVNAETPNAINHSYEEFASLLQIDVRGLSPNEIQVLVNNNLIKQYKNTKILFVLDNASTYDSIQDYINILHKQLLTNLHLHILITSRSQYWPEHPLILDIFTEEEAFVFVKKHLSNEKEKSITKLTEVLHCFPLALNQAVAYVKQHTNINDYLTLYTNKQQNYLDKFSGDRNQYTESLWKTWNIALTKLTTNAKEILLISSYLYPDDIPIAFFDNLTIEKRVNAIEDLRKHSFIILTNNNKSFKIHRLLQEVIRKTIGGANTNKHYGLTKAKKLINNRFNFSYTKHDKWASCGKYVIHVQSIAEHTINIKNKFSYTGIQLYTRIAMYLTYVQQDSKMAKDFWEKILTLVKQYYDKDESFSLIVANINTHVGFIMRLTGKMELAKEYLEKAVLTYNSKIPNIAGNIEKLLPHLRWEPKLTPYDGIKCDQSFALLNLGHVNEDLGNYKAAKDLYKEALNILGKCKSTQSTMIYKVALLQTLGNLYRYSGRLNKARNTLESARKIIDKNFPNHTEQAYVHERIANLLYYMGKYNKAKENLEKCLNIRFAIHSKEHYRIGHIKSMLGVVLCANNYINEGIINLKQAEIIYNKNFSEGHLRFIFLYIHMSYAFEMHKEYDKALLYLISSKKLAMKHWGEKSCHILLHQFSPIEKLPLLEISEKNLNYYQQTLDLTKQLFGPKHIRVARYHYLLGQVFRNIHNKEQARKHYQAALNISNNQHFDDEILTIGNHKNAEIIREQLMAL